MRWTEEEAKAHGFLKDKKGNWCAGKTSVQGGHSREVSKLESSSSVVSKAPDGVQREDERRGYDCYRIVVIARCRRHTDPDNLCPKWFIDRLKEFGVIPDDSSFYVREFVKRVVKIETWEPETTTIEVYEIQKETSRD